MNKKSWQELLVKMVGADDQAVLDRLNEVLVSVGIEQLVDDSTTVMGRYRVVARKIKPPTPRQIEVLDYIRSYCGENGFQPSNTEIAAHFGWSSGSSINCHIRALKRKGLVEVIGPRAIRDLRK